MVQIVMKGTRSSATLWGVLPIDKDAGCDFALHYRNYLCLPLGRSRLREKLLT